MSTQKLTKFLSKDSNLTAEEYCIICRKAGDLRMLSTKYRNNLIVENCNEMFQKCFNIKFPLTTDEGKYNKLCDECIARLRYCCGFRRDAEFALRRIQRRLSSLKPILAVKPKIYESPHATTDESDDDNHPLIVFKNKSNMQLNFEDEHDFDDDDENVTNKQLFLNDIKQFKGEKYCELKKLLFTKKEDLYSEDRWSVKTDEIYKATGYYEENSKIESRKPFIVPPLEGDCLNCPICNQIFKQQHSLIRHYDNHFPNWLCEMCGNTYVYRGSFKGHQKTNCRGNERYPCPQCDKTYKTKDMVKRHIKYHHKGDKAMTCYHCPQQFTGTVSRRMHMYKEHAVKCELFPCSMCHLKFFTEYRLKWHMRGKHYNEINYTCDICAAGFFAKFQLRDHMLKHSDAKIHQCEYCEKAFVRPKSLKEHVKIHLNIRKYNCDRCGLSFVQKCSLNNHFKTHNKE